MVVCKQTSNLYSTIKVTEGKRSSSFCVCCCVVIALTEQWTLMSLKLKKFGQC